MKSLKSRLFYSILFILIASLISSVSLNSPHRKFKKIQQYIDNATAQKLAGVAVYIKSPKYGEWVGTAGFSDLENKTPLVKDDIFSLASIGKMYNGVAVLKLVEEGKLKLDDQIKDYLPLEIIENIPSADSITIKHLLGHTSGFKNYNRDPELNRLYLTDNLKLDTLSHINVLRRYAYGQSIHSKTVGVYSYSSTNYLLLSMIVDSILPQGHEKYLKENILARYGFQHTYYKQTPPNKLVNHYGDINEDNVIENLSEKTIETTNWYSGDDGVYASIEDAAKFLQKLVKGKILNDEMLQEMMTWNDDKHPDYGLGLMADKGFPYKFLMGHSGRGIGVTTDLYYLPNQDMTVAIFCNTGMRSASPEFKKAYFKMRNKIMMKLFLF